MSSPNFQFHDRLAVEARSLSRARQLFVYFERIRAANLAKKEELRAYVEEARQRIIEIDLYLFELGQGYLHHSKVHVRSKVRYFPLIKARLDEKWRTLFRSKCFGPWLDITYVDNDETLVHHMLEKQLKSDDKHYDLSLIYNVNGHLLHFGHREFQLITGFRFGTPTLRGFRTGPFNFRDRVFPDKIGERLKNIDLLYLIEDDEAFSKISDEDAIRACLLLALEVIFMGRELISVVANPLVMMVDSLETWNDFPWGEHIWRMLYDVTLNVNSFQRDVFHKELNMNPNFEPSYSLGGFILPFKSGRWWTKAPNVRPRAIAWTKKVSFEASELFGELFPEGEKRNYELYPTRDEGASESFRRSVKFFNWYVPRPAPVDEVGLVDEYFRKRSEARKKMVAEDAEEDAENRTNLHAVSIMERVEIIQEMCGSLLKLPAEVQSLKGRVHKLEFVIHIMTRKRRAGDTVQHVNKAEQKCSQDSKKGRVEFGSNVESDLANEYCTNLNDNFLNLFDAPIQQTQQYVVFDRHEPWQKYVGTVEEVYDEDVEQSRVEFGSNVESDLANEYCTNLNDNFLNYFDAPIQQTQQYVVFDHHEPWQKYVGTGLQDVCPKVEEVYDEDVEQVILDDCEKVDKHEAEIRRLGAVRDETLRLRQEEEKTFEGGGVMKLPHIKLGLNRSGPKKREYKYVLRPPITEDLPKHVIPTLETLKSQKNIRDPFMIEMCRDVKPWEEDLKRRHNSIDTIIIDRDFEEFLNSSWSPRCKFPWCSDIVVDRLFWNSLAGLDNNSSGWLRDEVFIPINEPFTHWSLAVFYIQTGDVVFYDSGETYEVEYREWYFKMRRCLRENLPFILKETCVFEKKGIDPTSYSINFRHVTHIPKQGGVSGDCGIFLCIFLYRLAYGIPLVMDDSTQTALAYREALIRFYFKHKICCP
ncbi:phospholipase-like protein [Artemisia annua]|uniref:Phospholipase-like protein n=1 Tax=Artemisia annua TaxID=35608 RepID=A0A2U1LCP0_ARTAN|nr:phospholipase-like protein [Artemisia annua]